MDPPGYQDGENSERAEGTGGGGGNCRHIVAGAWYYSNVDRHAK